MKHFIIWTAYLIIASTAFVPCFGIQTQNGLKTSTKAKLIQEFDLSDVIRKNASYKIELIPNINANSIPCVEVIKENSRSEAILLKPDGRKNKLNLPGERYCLQVFSDGNYLAVLGKTDGPAGIALCDGATGKALAEFSGEMDFGEGINDEILGQEDGKRFFITHDGELKIFDSKGLFVRRHSLLLGQFELKESKTGKYIGFDTYGNLCLILDNNLNVIFSKTFKNSRCHIDFFPSEEKASLLCDEKIFFLDLKGGKLDYGFNLPFAPRGETGILSLPDHSICVFDSDSLWFKNPKILGFKNAFRSGEKKRIYKIGKFENGAIVGYDFNNGSAISFFDSTGMETQLYKLNKTKHPSVACCDGFFAVLERGAAEKVKLYKLTNIVVSK